MTPLFVHRLIIKTGCGHFISTLHCEARSTTYFMF